MIYFFLFVCFKETRDFRKFEAPTNNFLLKKHIFFSTDAIKSETLSIAVFCDVALQEKLKQLKLIYIFLNLFTLIGTKILTCFNLKQVKSCEKS